MDKVENSHKKWGGGHVPEGRVLSENTQGYSDGGRDRGGQVREGGHEGEERRGEGKGKEGRGGEKEGRRGGN